MSRILVFIPMFNAATTLVETLNGVSKSADFQRERIDVMIVDDCSTDTSFEIAKSFCHPSLNIEVLKNEQNLGERGTINLYFEKVRLTYKWVLLIHADDIPKNHWIPTIIEHIDVCDSNRTFSIWSSYDCLMQEEMTIIPGDNTGQTVTYKRQPEDASQIIKKVSASFHVSGCALNLSVFHDIGGFDAAMPQYGDTDFFARAIGCGYNDIYIRKTLTIYRININSVSFATKRTNKDLDEIYYLIQKHNKILKKTDKLHMLRMALFTSLKRMIKGAIHYKYHYSMSAFHHFLKCTFLMLKTITI